jgi:uncharacterized protein Yka (UPF0111/DUF47 family)
VDRVSQGRWFLPETPDVLGRLRDQLGVTIDGVDAFAKWAAGDPEAAVVVRESEQRGDAAKRELLRTLRAAFVTPLEPEDLFTLSRGIDWILNYVRDLVTESEIMSSPPDPGLAEMAELLAEAMRHIDDALRALDSDQEAATEAADAAVDAERRLEATYYRGMAALLDVEDRQQRIARRELYRRCARIGEVVIDVSERIVYAVVKES